MLAKHLNLKVDGNLESIVVSTAAGHQLSITHDYRVYGDVALAVFKQAVVLFGVEDHSGPLRRTGLLKAALNYYADTHCDQLVAVYSGDLTLTSQRAHYHPLKRGIYITIGERWIFTYRPDFHTKNGFVSDRDSLVSKLRNTTSGLEHTNFETLMAECQSMRSFK